MLINGFCTAELDGTLIHRTLTPAEAGTHFTSLIRMESCVNFGGKEGHTNIQHSAALGFEPGILWFEGRVLTSAPTMPP